MDTTVYFSSNYIYFFPIILIFYSAVPLIKKFLQSDYDILDIRRFYYSFIFLVTIIVLKNVDLSWISEDKGLFQLSGNAWAIIIFLTITVIVALIIDMWIISGDTFQEFSFLSAKLVKSDTKIALKNLETSVSLLEKNIKALYDSNRNIEELFTNDEIIKQIKNNSFNLIENFEDILVKYYKKSQLNVTVDINLVNDIQDELEAEIKKYNTSCNLNYRNIKWIKRNLKELENVSFTKNDCMIMFSTYRFKKIYDDKILLVVIKSQKKEIFSTFDDYIISNLLELYEMLFWDTTVSIYIDDINNGGSSNE
ncbi:hypothetical protein [Intestinibacter bartlettii]|uniref:hypothetical protein n=1 Tax=Intestinibacter bartlettii TaxID=261299 RepID=UPI00319EAEE3